MALASSIQFEINIKGSVTGREHVGLFEAKTKTSVMDTLEENRVYRRVLGENPQDAADDIKRIAEAYAYLQIRLIKFPDWWKEAGHGLGLEDLEVLAKVNNTAREKIGAEYEKLAAEADAAKKGLKEEAAKLG